MKFKVYIIKKQQLIWAAIILVIVIVLAVVLVNLKSRKTFSIMDSPKTYHIDVDGDGKNDSIVVNIDSIGTGYTVDVITSDGKGYALEPDPIIKTLGNNTKWWPLNILAEDVNGDGVCDIILQSGDEKGPVLHIYKCSSTGIERIASGRYSIFGSLKHPSKDAKIVVLGNKMEDTIHFTFLQGESGSLSPYTSAPLAIGKEALSSLITFIEKEDVETSAVNAESKYVSKISKGQFLDGSFTEVKFTKYDIPTELTYILRTSTTIDEEQIGEFYKIKMLLTSYDEINPEYRISNITKLK